MFLVIRKSQLVLSCFVVALLIISLSIYNYADAPDVVDIDKSLLIIDAGHGGMDGGAVGINGVLEKDINLKVAAYLKKLAEADGRVVVMTRSEDVSLSTTKSTVIRNQKRSDLENRRSILAKNKSGIFVSIHMNKYEQESVRGAQVFYADNSQSRIIADNIQSALRDGIDKNNKRVAKLAPSNLYIFKGCSSAAVVVECGFLSNAEEEKLLSTDDYQKKLAECIYNGICK